MNPIRVRLRLLLSLLLLTSLIVMARTPIQDDLLKTRAERSNYEETTRYAEVISFVSELQKRTDKLRVESFGRTEEGRELPLLILADPPIAHPREARVAGKPVIFVQANIHAGEVEGKEAMLMLARRIVLGDLKSLLNDLIILIAPIYNADGNERIDLKNRTAQYGPVGGVGTRENAKGYDLNRDYMKLETPEANALISLFNRWDPHLIVDLHTTNGSYHGYHLTYAPMLNPNADARLIAFERNRMLPAITRAVKAKHGFRMYYYGNFATKERLNRELDSFEIQRAGRAAQPSETEAKVWRTFSHRPMFGNNYAGLRHRLTILSEAYSYLDFKGRVDVTAAFVAEIFRYSAMHADEIVQLIRRIDADTVRRGAVAGAKKPVQLGVNFELKPLPKEVPILVGEVEKKKNPRSGKEMMAMLENKYRVVTMPDYGLFAATKSAALPHAYLLRNEAGLQAIIEKLIAHGIAVEELTEPLAVAADSFVIDKVTRARGSFQGHQAISLAGHTQTETIRFPAGSILIRTAQPLATLAFYLLEAESDDGFVTWNFLDAYLEKGKTYPVYKLSQEVKAASRLK